MDGAAQTTEPSVRLDFDGRAGELYVIFIVNLLLSIATLGIYRFWARTRVRRYLWAHSSAHGDAIEYTGTGPELFLGFLIALAALIPIVAVYQAIYLLMQTRFHAPDEVLVVFDTVYSLAFLFLIGFALYRARRYRLSRTVWRGIRAAQTGSAVDFAWRYLGYVLLTVLTLGFYWPFMNVNLAAYVLNHTWLGDRRLVFEGSGRDLFKRFAICWIALIPTLGTSWFWYKSAEWEYIVSRTRYENLRFRVNAGEISVLLLVNFILGVVTLGLAYPFVMIRIGRFIAGNLEVSGEQDFALIAQSLEQAPARGEGFASVLDVGEF